MRAAIILAAASLLAGCSTLDAMLVNRAACTIGGGAQRELHVTSFWGRWGITARIHEDDAKAACAEVTPVILQVAPKGAGA